MSIIFRDNSLKLETAETVDTFVTDPAIAYSAVIMGGKPDQETAFRLRRYGNTLSQVALNGPWNLNGLGFKADGSATAYFDVDVTQQVPRTLFITGAFSKGSRIAGIAFGDPDTLKSFYVERGSGLAGSGFPSKNFIPVWSGAAIGTAGKQLSVDNEPDGALTLFIRGDTTGVSWGVVYNGVLKLLAKDTTYQLSNSATGRTRVGGTSAQPTGAAVASHRIYAAASFPVLLSDDDVLQLGMFFNDYAKRLGATMYE